MNKITINKEGFYTADKVYHASAGPQDYGFPYDIKFKVKNTHGLGPRAVETTLIIKDLTLPHQSDGEIINLSRPERGTIEFQLGTWGGIKNGQVSYGINDEGEEYCHVDSTIDVPGQEVKSCSYHKINDKLYELSI